MMLRIDMLNDIVSAGEWGDECIKLPFSVHSTGYYSVRVNGKVSYAHRYILAAVTGQMPAGMYASHYCGNRACVNPKHLRWATPKENADDRLLHGTDARGTNNPNSKLSEEAVREILSSSASGKSMVEKFGISKSVVSLIRSRKIWSHVVV